MVNSSRGSSIHILNAYAMFWSKTLEADLYPFGIKDTSWPSPEGLFSLALGLLGCACHDRTAEAELCLITSQQIPRPGSLHPKSAQTTDAPEYPE